jgi:hypothetical protein
MEKTAVEWLVEQICGDHTSEWQEQINQAKEMEKEQIETAFIKGNEFLPEWNINNVPYIDAEQYYKQTFKSE